ncbi:hypothetical protein Tco_0287093 [Tanacetum coccineum]
MAVPNPPLIPKLIQQPLRLCVRAIILFRYMLKEAEEELGRVVDAAWTRSVNGECTRGRRKWDGAQAERLRRRVLWNSYKFHDCGVHTPKRRSANEARTRTIILDTVRTKKLEGIV